MSGDNSNNDNNFPTMAEAQMAAPDRDSETRESIRVLRGVRSEELYVYCYDDVYCSTCRDTTLIDCRSCSNRVFKKGSTCATCQREDLDEEEKRAAIAKETIVALTK
jgi:hypothetical protein